VITTVIVVFQRRKGLRALQLSGRVAAVVDPLSIAIGVRLREIREGKGLSQDELAARAGIHRTFVGRVERGETNITMKTLYKIASGLGILVPELLPSEFGKRENVKTKKGRGKRTPLLPRIRTG
jgi:ribosome-binding protein aMBF1 (putative translation factor)